ncbi:uncharacterized protein LOC126574768 [Anopheles aquasalis]|uniref:uncharacterized protein LOC126574768 n=1 Tax=Anopheles aquasalis TaxID=42839 RepID=UPI00215AF960|nr:uncharacterized protein LOC126574768 [Anopheles aquasalis]
MQSRRYSGNLFADPGKDQCEMLGENDKNRPPIATTTNCNTWQTADTILTAFGTPSVEPPPLRLMFPVISSTTIDPSYDQLQAPGSFQETHPICKPAKRPRCSTPADEIVVSNGDVFHIRFIDEPPIDEGLPSSTCPIVQPDGQLFDGADGSYTYTVEPAVDRDWINYDELPMLSKLNSAAPVSDSETALATVEVHDSGALCCPSLLISAESSGWPATEATLMHNTPALSVEPAACRAKRAEVSSPRKRRNRRHKTKAPATNGIDSNGGWHDFRNYCVECTKFFPTAEDLELHMESYHRLVGDRPPPTASMLHADDLALNHVPHAREMESFYTGLFQRSANKLRSMMSEDTPYNVM